MTGLDGRRVYLDWNATAPLRPEARDAMLSAMDAVGNPSSVHGEGRAAKAIVERARASVARLAGCAPDRVVFTSGATESAALALAGRSVRCGAVEHDCVAAWCDATLPVSEAGRVAVADPGTSALQAANSETGVVQDLPLGLAFVDAVQAAGRLDFRFDATGARAGALSAHKIGGPAGVGAVLLGAGVTLAPRTLGGGQEQGARAGTENVVGLAGFGAAAEAALRDHDDGMWDRVEKLRNILEMCLEDAVPEIIFFGAEGPRLANTSCFAVAGWRGETQVMQLDLSGFAVSAGSACSSGKVNRASRVLMAMGHDETTASSAIRVSMGPTTTEAEVMAFADTWIGQYRRRRARAA